MKQVKNLWSSFVGKLEKKKNFHSDILVVIFILTLGIFWFCITLFQYQGFSYKTGDTAVAEQAIWNTVHGRFLYQSFLGTQTNLREHVSLIQLAYVPFYAIFQHTLTLFFIIQLSFVLGSIYLFYYAKRKLGFAAGVLVTGLFVFNPLTASQVVGNMHVVAIAGPAFLVMLIAYHEKWQRQFLFWTIFMVMVSEFVAPTIVLVGVLAFLEKRSWKWFLPPLAGGVGLYIAAKYYITIGFGSNEDIISKFKPTALKSIYKMEERLDLVREFLAPLLWIFPWFSKYSILLIPSLLIALIIIIPGRIGIGNHVFILVPPVLSMIFVDLLERLPRYRRWLYVIVVIGILISLHPWWKSMKIDRSEYAQEMSRAVTAVKDGGSVTTSTQFGPRLCRREEFFFSINDKMTDYVVLKLNKNRENTEDAEKTKLKYDQRVANSGMYREVFREGRVVVFAKKEKILKLLNISYEELAEMADEELQKRWRELK